MKFTYDKKAKAIYICLTDEPYASGERLDDERYIDYANDGSPIGVEFLYVNHGINLTDIPEADSISKILHENGMMTYTHETYQGNQMFFLGTRTVHVCYAANIVPTQDPLDECSSLTTHQIPQPVEVNV